MRWRYMHSTRTRFGYFLVQHNPWSFDPIFRLYNLPTARHKLDKLSLTHDYGATDSFTSRSRSAFGPKIVGY